MTEGDPFSKFVVGKDEHAEASNAYATLERLSPAPVLSAIMTDALCRAYLSVVSRCGMAEALLHAAY